MNLKDETGWSEEIENIVDYDIKELRALLRIDYESIERVYLTIIRVLGATNNTDKLKELAFQIIRTKINPIDFCTVLSAIGYNIK